MGATTVELRSFDGIQAVMEWAGTHTVIGDHPEGQWDLSAGCLQKASV
jgi:hypothetical protein